MSHEEKTEAKKLGAAINLNLNSFVTKRGASYSSYYEKLLQIVSGLERDDVLWDTRDSNIHS